MFLADRCVCGQKRAMHPHTLKTLHPEFIKYAGSNGSIFARKFAPQVEDNDGWMWWVRLWEMDRGLHNTER